MAEEIPFGIPRRRQHRPWGWFMRTTGFAMAILSILTFFGGVNQLQRSTNAFDDRPGWVSVLLALALWVASSALYVFGRAVKRYGRRHTTPVIRTMGEAKSRSYTLFLRPFESDKATMSMFQATSLFGLVDNTGGLTVEEKISRLFKGFGRLVAVGQPDERLPQPGAARLYLPLHNWQGVVASLIDDAQLVVLVTGTSPGTLWEFREILSRRGPHDLILVVLTDEQEYAVFREKADKVFAEHFSDRPDVPAFPDYPPLWRPENATWLPTPRGYIFFEPDWSPRFVRLDPTATQALRKKKIGGEMNRVQLLPAFEKFFLARAEAAAREDLRDSRKRMPLAGIERFVREFVAEEKGSRVPLRVTFTPRLGVATVRRVVPLADNTEDTLTSRQFMSATAGTHIEKLTMDLPAADLLDLLRTAREQGAGDSDTLRVGLDKRNVLSVIVEPTGVAVLRIDHRTFGFDGAQSR